MTNRVFLLALMCVSISLTIAAADDEGDRLFALKVQPILKSKCLGCHGADPDEIAGEFLVTSREALLRGGESEDAAIVPGHPDQGTFVEAIKWDGLEMPPKENDRLTDEQIEVIQKWIQLGAPWPDEQTQKKYRDEDAKKLINDDGMLIETSGGTSEQWTMRRYKPDETWAYMPVRTAEELLPASVNPQKAIDYFIDQSLEAGKLIGAAEASPRNLIRRATYDLTGLPPTPQEVNRFEKAYAENGDAAWKQLVDRLLQSPRYGEHWGRHWLDVTRYADTGGMSNDFERSNMWRYRDYVIRSFNEDKPYDQFIIEQLAGDELADKSFLQRTKATQKQLLKAQESGKFNQQEAEWLVATGFLRSGPWDNAMITTEEARQIYIDDVVNITGQAFLGQTLRCCKCHDHKFDPIPTRDYYRMYAVFSTTQLAERPAPFLDEESKQRFEAGEKHVRKMLEFASAEKNKLVNKRESAAKKWFEEHELPYKNEQARKNLPDDQKPPRHVGLDHVEQGQLKVREQDEWIWKRRLERYQPMVQSVFNSDVAKIAWNGARKLRIYRQPAKKPLENHILTGGALTALGDKVSPGVLSAISLPVSSDISTSSKSDRYRITDSIDGRRLQLAKWIADPANSLTTRAIVNRIWQYHFGVGLAANANNLGAKGAKPSHPELLDFLADDFVNGGWKFKRMHRMIMMSKSYRRASVPVDEKAVGLADPNNQLLSYFPRRRLTAEEARDSMLSITGELVHGEGGVPIMPEINMEVALQPRMIQFSLAPAYQPSPTPDERNRRTIYAYHVRGQADPFRELFNQPNPNESCELREAAAVTPQVFTLLNSELLTDRSLAFAKRLISESDQIDSQISRAFELALGRKPVAEELTWMKNYVRDMTKYHVASRPAVTKYPSQITRSLVEEFSGKPFEYTEILPVFEAYTPDTKPDEVDASTRALADMCLLIFNTNEFMYVE